MVLYVKSTREPIPCTATRRVKGQNPSATKQTRCLISELAEARGDVGRSAGTGSEIKARLVVMEEDSLLGD